MSVADQQYFHHLRCDPALAAVLDRLGFTEVRVFEMGSSAGIWISKPEWLVPHPAAHGEAVWVHFEALRPGECRLEIDTHPYVPGIGQKPEKLAEFAGALRRKAALLSKLRAAVMAERGLHSLGASLSALRDPEAPDASTAVKFVTALPEGAPPAAAAAWVAEVVALVAPVVDRCLSAAS
jgi:hypothetical protein